MEILDNDIDLSLSDGENKPSTSADKSNEVGETTRPRQLQLRWRHAVISLDTPLMKENFHPLPDQRMNTFQS